MPRRKSLPVPVLDLEEFDFGPDLVRVNGLRGLCKRGSVLGPGLTVLGKAFC
jgi:hypothetical protein